MRRCEDELNKDIDILMILRNVGQAGSSTFSLVDFLLTTAD
jgi:hypothetical protein